MFLTLGCVLAVVGAALLVFAPALKANKAVAPEDDLMQNAYRAGGFILLLGICILLLAFIWEQMPAINVQPRQELKLKK